MSVLRISSARTRSRVGRPWDGPVGRDALARPGRASGRRRWVGGAPERTGGRHCRAGGAPLLAVCAALLAVGCGGGMVESEAPIVFASVSAGGDHTCGLTEEGAAYCWGRGENGELGDGQIHNAAVPVRVRDGLRFLQVSAGGNHTCGLAEDGAAYCWGWNVAGQLGTGNTVSYGDPTPVAGDLRFTALSSGAQHTCGIAEDGAAYCWGDNGSGQLGTGTSTATAAPAPVVGGLRFAAIDAGAGHTCGITTDGIAYCWGLNHQGQLGTGDLEDAWEPVAVTGDVAFSAISAGFAHTCALTAEGAAYCWGSNNAGELGNSFIDRPRAPGTASPGPVVGGSTFLAIDAGAHYTCAAGPNHVPYCWGRGLYGQLGTGRTVNVATPQIVVDTPPEIARDRLRVTEVSTGGTHTCGRATSGLIFCWGTGELGQLGNPSYTYTTIPVRVTAE